MKELFLVLGQESPRGSAKLNKCCAIVPKSLLVRQPRVYYLGENDDYILALHAILKQNLVLLVFSGDDDALELFKNLLALEASDFSVQEIRCLKNEPCEHIYLARMLEEKYVLEGDFEEEQIFEEVTP